jgi:alpha-N-arabinofuranosidase
LPFGGDAKQGRGGFADEFDDETLDLQWNFRRAPLRRFYHLDANPGSLRLDLQAGAIGSREQYSFIGIRQRHFEFDAVTKMNFVPVGDEEAGLVVIQNDRSAFLMTASAGPGGNMLKLTQSLHGESIELATAPYDGDFVFLKVSGNYLAYRFLYSADGEAWSALGSEIDGTALSPAAIEGYNYTGVYIGLYATSNRSKTRNYADFDFFTYEPTAGSRDGWFHRQVSDEDIH